MNNKQTTKRLDEILIGSGLVTEEQIREVLEVQKKKGGKIGSLLIRAGYLDEAGLLNALAEQLGCAVVELENQDIHDIIISFLPSTVVRARKVVPFDYNPDDNILKVACENPHDNNLLNEIRFVTRGKNVELYIASEISITAAIKKYYPILKKKDKPKSVTVIDNIDTNENDDLINIPAEKIESVVAEDEATTIDSRDTVLIVTDNHQADAALIALYNQSRYHLMIADSIDAALQSANHSNISRIYIQKAVPGDFNDLTSRLRKINPALCVRFYSSVIDCIESEPVGLVAAEAAIRNLDLLTSILAAREGDAANYSGRVGLMVNQLCIRLGLEESDRLAIITAAFLHDLARHYYGESPLTGAVTILDEPDNKKTVNLSARLLDSLGYSSVVTGILNSMYTELNDKHKSYLMPEILGANIISVVDTFCRIIPSGEPLSFENLEQIRSSIGEKLGTIFLEEVATPFIEMIEEEVVAVVENERHSQIMLFHHPGDDIQEIITRLQCDRYRVVPVDSLNGLKDMISRSEPDYLIISQTGSSEDIIKSVSEISKAGIKISTLPTFMLLENDAIAAATSLLEEGVEDIIPRNAGLDLLIAKLNKLRSRLEQDDSTVIRFEHKEPGARGSLADMNLVNLMQTIGPSHKTARLILNCDDGEIIIYFQQGEAVFASFGAIEGDAAIMKAFDWNTGSWELVPIADSELPETNITGPNELILKKHHQLVQ